ncbi:patatin family protein [Radiobacillus sp. PE A8.2]|uniref:patatin-like phospholipase family protein n=1 Tax=Radiobacillus sp. PE A8.2 TaxID=3380349 RepID=UPI00388FBB45
MLEQTGLVLEGGGMRGTYTAGVLDYFHDEDITFPYVIGASAGASVGSSYISRQRGRNYKVLVEYGEHPEYISFKRWFKNKELFGMDFIFDILPKKLVPFDFETFFETKIKFVVGATDITTGEAVYFNEFHNQNDLLQVIRASSSLPLLAPSIHIQGKELLDGGIADPIPIQPSINAGNKKHVVVLTRNPGYVKKAMKFSWLFSRTYKDHPKLIKAIATRHLKYNQTIAKIEEMEKNGEVLVIRPQAPLHVSRIERNREKLHALYLQGYKEAESYRNRLREFLDLET